MSDKLLSQSDIDSLLSGLAGTEQAPPKAQADPPAAVMPQGVSQASQPAVTPPEPARAPEAHTESASTLPDRGLDLEQRLGRLETTAGRLERLEKLVADIRAAQASPPQLQAMVKQVQGLSEEVRRISTKLLGTLGYDAYHGFKCDGCSSQGTVATVFKCTKCGHESWRGWWPKK